MLQGDTHSTLCHPIKIPPCCLGGSALSSFLGTQRMHFSWLSLWHLLGAPALVPSARMQQCHHPPQWHLAEVTTGRSRGSFSCLLSALVAPVPTHSPIPGAVLALPTALTYRSETDS